MRWLDRMRVVVADLETADRNFPADDLIRSIRTGIAATEHELRRWQHGKRIV